MRKMYKKETGITLVALVVTIIILLILAGITISQLSGSGLFENAKLAEQKSKNAQDKEDGILADYELQIGAYIDGTRNANADNYSTEETEIGTWIDGKKLYRKVYQQTTTNTIDLSDLNYDYIQVESKLYLKHNNLGEYQWRQEFYFNNDYYFRSWITDSSTSLNYDVGTGYTLQKVISVVEYTKK